MTYLLRFWKQLNFALCLLLASSQLAYAFPSGFEISFAKVSHPTNRAGCIIVWQKNTGKNIFCRYELGKKKDFDRDDEKGINLSDVIVHTSSNNFNFKLKLKKWIIHQYPHLKSDPNNYKIFELVRMISALETISDTKQINFARKKRDIYHFNIKSTQNNVYPKEPKKQFAWLVHHTITQEMQTPGEKYRAKEKQRAEEKQRVAEKQRTEENTNNLENISQESSVNIPENTLNDIIFEWVQTAKYFINVTYVRPLSACCILLLLLLLLIIKRKKTTHFDTTWHSLKHPLGLILKDRLDIISTSDTAAYAYCQQRLSNTHKKMGLERFLLYDCRAGTLNLSLIQITWNQAGIYPTKWQVENRLEVPLAGNHLDCLLARIIDHHLTQETVLHPKVCHYKYPIVQQTDNTPADKLKHRIAMSRLWQEIRHTKHHWDGQIPFRIKIGAYKTIGLIDYRGKTTKNNSELASIEASDLGYFLNIPANLVYNNPLVQKYMNFVTDTILNELLQGAGISTEEVNTVLISGRGALWPGLRERVWNKFPTSCHKPNLKVAHHLKNPFVSGGIAWKVLSQVQKEQERNKPSLAILCDNTKILVLEKDWGKKGGINLSNDSTFSLVQIAHHHPNPKPDLQSLHGYFYIRIQQYYRHLKWTEHPYLFVNRKGNIIRLANDKNEGFDFTYLAMSNYCTFGTNGMLPQQELYY